MTIETVKKGRRVGVSRDGKAIGYAVRVPKVGTWTAFVYMKTPPFDVARPGFADEAAAVAFIAEHGEPHS